MAAQSAVMSMLVLLAVASFAAAAVQVVTEYDDSLPDRDAVNDMCMVGTCGECLANGCGWCGATFTCMYGDVHGPIPTAFNTTPTVCADQWTFPGNETWGSCVKNVNSRKNPEYPQPPRKYQVNCANGGQRAFGYSPHFNAIFGSSYCECPEGWAGNDCQSCVSDDVCRGNKPGNYTCTHQPFPDKSDNFEQTYSCSCAGESATQICNLLSEGLPDSVRMTLKYNVATESANITWQSSVPKEIPWRLLDGISFFGDLENCKLNTDIGACPTGSEYNWHGDEPCAEITCEPKELAAPYPQGPESICPLKDQCCTVWEWDQSWRYRACPQWVKVKVDAVNFICQYSKQGDGYYNCAFTTAGFGPFAMQCYTGTCVFNAAPTPPPPAPPKGPLIGKVGWYIIILAVPALCTIVLSACCAVALYARHKELKQLEVLSNGNLMGGGRRAESPRAKRKRVRSTESPLLEPDKDATSAFYAATDTELGRGRAPPSPMVPESLPAYLRDHQTGPLPTRNSATLAGAGVPDTPEFSFSNVRYKVRLGRNKYRPVLRGLSATLPASLFAIMGPSGSGKTTLLDILAGRKSTSGGIWSGDVFIDGVKFSTYHLQRSVGYIMQDDVMMGTQTVREYLLFQTRMRLPPHLSAMDRYSRVQHVIEDLGLTRVANTRIGDAFMRGLSGGEKRRVSIAAELLTDPKVLLVDEPTSGLDSANAKSVVDALARVARSGRVVVMSIHQPRSYIWSQFDGLLLLGKKGEILYCSSRERCLEHFAAQGFQAPSNYNPADFLLDMVAGLTDVEAARLSMNHKGFPGSWKTRAERIADAYNAAAAAGAGAGAGAGDGTDGAASSEDGDSKASPAVPQVTTVALVLSPAATLARYQRQGATRLRATWELSLRTFLNVLRNPFLLMLNYVATAVVAILAGLVFHHLPFNFNGLQDRLGLMFFSFLFFSMTSLSSLGIWREERLLFLRERAANVYSTTPYFVAKVVCDILPLRVLPPIIFSAAIYFQAGMNDLPERFLWFTVVLTLVNVIAASICLAVGALIPNLSLGNLVASLILLFCLLMCGLLSHNDNTVSFMHIVQRASFLNYAFEILANNELIGQTYNLSPTLPNHKVMPPFPATGETVVLTFGLSLDNFDVDIISMFAFMLFFLICVYFILAFLVKERR